jgi:hypothetical protein
VDLSGVAAGLGIPAGGEIKWNPPRGSLLKSARRTARQGTAPADARNRTRPPRPHGHVDQRPRHDSRHVPHLQLADLVATAITGAVAGNPPALELGPLPAKLIPRNSLGDANGAGGREEASTFSSGCRPGRWQGTGQRALSAPHPDAPDDGTEGRDAATAVMIAEILTFTRPAGLLTN